MSIPIDGQWGVADGNTLRLSDRGAIGRRGGYYGDLYIHLQVEEHPIIERQGDHLLHRLHIPMTQAALGVDLEYETLDSREKISVQPGTQSGHVFRLKGKGVPRLNGRGRGDFVIEIIVDTVLENIGETLSSNGRVEIRGFGTFSVRHRSARNGRNPRTGEAVVVPAKNVPMFKPGKGVRDRLNYKA